MLVFRRQSKSTGHKCEGLQIIYSTVCQLMSHITTGAASEGADGEVQGSRSSLVRMRDVDPPEVPLRQAPYNPPQDVASNSESLVQVAEQAHPLVQRCPSPNPMREHRNNRTHEEVVVGGGATPHG